MSRQRVIYWRPDLKEEEGKPFANIHLLVGYNQGTLKDFQEMAAELRETFPEATDDQIQGGKVHKSSMVNGFTLITYNAHIPRGEYPGWEQVESGHIEYCW